MKLIHWQAIVVMSFLTSALFLSCGGEKVEAPDVSNIQVDYDILRSEQDLMRLDTNDVLVNLEALMAKDSAFYDIYFSNVLRVPLNRLNEEERAKFVKGFIRDDRIQRISHEVDSVFTDFSDMKPDFKEAFQYLKYYFPKKQTPDLYTFISEYSVQRFIFEDGPDKDGLGIGLDMFLGEDYPYLDYTGGNASFSKYLARRFNKRHMVKKVMETVVDDMLQDVRGDRLLDKMIHNGKKLYILQLLLPNASKQVIMEYTQDQLEWCEDNEAEMWAFFFNEELFYSTDINKISKLVNPSPNSSGMPPEAPGRTANYMGWQIVKAFMKRNPNVTLDELIAMEDSQKILEKSKYKPKRK